MKLRRLLHEIRFIVSIRKVYRVNRRRSNLLLDIAILVRTLKLGSRKVSRYGKLWLFSWADFTLGLLPIFGRLLRISQPRKIFRNGGTCVLRNDAMIFHNYTTHLRSD